MVTKTIYLVKAYDKTTDKIVTFNQMMCDTLDNTLKLAKHLHNDCSEWYSNVVVITEVYELKNRDIFRMDGEDR